MPAADPPGTALATPRGAGKQLASRSPSQGTGSATCMPAWLASGLTGHRVLPGGQGQESDASRENRSPPEREPSTRVTSCASFGVEGTAARSTHPALPEEGEAPGPALLDPRAVPAAREPVSTPPLPSENQRH